MMKRFLVLLFILISMPVSALTVDKIIVFGDSLSDNGNVYAATWNKVPREPYYQGRFTNGLTWVENLADIMKMQLIDYAYGGAWAEPYEDSTLYFPYDLSTQVQTYLLQSVFDWSRSQHLFVIWSGANDYLVGRDNVEYATTNTVVHIQKQIETLIESGAKQVAVLNLPNLAETPLAHKLGAEYTENVRVLTQMHNEKLAAMLAKEQTQHPDVKIIAVDITKYFDELITNHASYGISNVYDSCYDSNVLPENTFIKVDKLQQKVDVKKSVQLREVLASGASKQAVVQACPNPDEYMFWDHVHPTRVVTRLLAKAVYDDLRRYGINA